jgi:hypothetical protein
MSFDFEKIMQDMDAAFKLSRKEVEGFKASPVFKVTAAIPYVAGGEDADRAAYVHLSALIVAARLGDDAVSSFRGDDLSSLERRLQYVFNFVGGDEDVIRQGKALSMYYMLLDYKRDLEEDIKRVKANPASDDFDFDVDAELAKLKAEVDKGDAFDSLFGARSTDAASTASYWKI